LLTRTIVTIPIRRYWAIAAACVWLSAVAYIAVLYLVYRLASTTESGFFFIVLRSLCTFDAITRCVVLFCFGDGRS